jgi:NAD(P)-dependent dehydrogenase (short-subunit alcohol dehydrogenase family)
MDVINENDHMKKFSKHVLLTGGGGALGHSIIKHLLSETSSYLTVLTRDPNKLTAQYSQDELLRINVLKADFCNPDSLYQIIPSILNKNIDVLINNAGINLATDPLQMTCEQIQETLNINFIAPFITAQLVSNHMLQKKIKGCIINIASIKGHEASSDIGYGASKAALIQMTKTFAKRLAKENISVNAIAPGVLEHTSQLMPQDKKNKYLDLTASGRFSRPSDVANLILFLINDVSQSINGQCINIDNGYKI